jgi:two-component system NarL family sensor kinase
MNDKYLIQVFISGTILLMLFVFFIVAYLLVQKQKQNAYHIEKNKMIFDHQNKLLTARFEEQEQTMNLMSKEIHDNIGQLLTFTQMNLSVIGKYASDQRQIGLIDRTKMLLDQIKNDVRNISHSLNSDFIKERGLVSVLEDELESIKFSQEIDCKINITGGKADFDPGKELLIYRIAQEAIHNITKHAKASKITIALSYDPDIFTMSIADDGVGFEKQRIYELNGIGFQNMLERTRLLSGSLDIESQPMHGCNITLRVDCALLQMADKTPGSEPATANIL